MAEKVNDLSPIGDIQVPENQQNDIATEIKALPERVEF
jgi:hypothetical protein